MPLPTKPHLSLADARPLAQGCEQAAIRLGRHITLAVVDDGGAVLTLSRMDGAPATGAEIAPAKARLAALGRRDSLDYETMIGDGKTAFLSALLLPGIRGAALEGGVAIRVDGHCVGAVGIAGASSSEDAAIARAGIAALLGN